MVNIKNIKLVIWDLDDTFWKGTLSEEDVIPIDKNIMLVKELTRMGIVNSICSKNDYSKAKQKLQDLNIFDYFVFISIDWTPKGKRIGTIISNMRLRAENVLFIDDNIQNLNEAQFYEPHLMVSLPNIIDTIIEYSVNYNLNNISTSRLDVYKILEAKQKSKTLYSDNIEFLYSTHTCVSIKYDCENVFDRIYELIQRTNQLNYTKLRSTKEELKKCLLDKDNKCGYVTVKDDFGDYGIVGFFAINSNKLIHFLFSCRTIGQGVEQYVYSKLGYPNLEISGDVINNVTKDSAPGWINISLQNTKYKSIVKPFDSSKIVLFKGACDLSFLASFLNKSLLVKEFSYISDDHKTIEHHNHSVNILGWYKLTKEEKNELLNTCIFNDKEMFDTRMFDSNVGIVFLSTQIEPNLGIYVNKKSKLKIAFAEWCYPLTDKKNWDKYINNEINTYGNKFSIEFLEKFSKEWSFIGRISIDEYIENIKQILTLINRDAKLCLLLGSETPYIKNEKLSYVDRHKIYKEFNERLKDLAKSNNRLLLLSFNDFIRNQDDFLDNINHYQRRVYYEASKIACRYINDALGKNVMHSNKISYYIDEIRRILKKIVKCDTIMYSILRYIYRKVR